jgi:glycosyltransferase involved in cell wall biosynthesis
MLAFITGKILFQTRSDLDEAIHYKIGRPDQYVLIGNGVALDDFFRVDQKKIRNKRKELSIGNLKVVGTVGRVSVQKNPVGFVHIAEEVLSKRKDVMFLFVGGGELLEKVQNIVMELGLGDRIIFTGFRRDIPEIMANFDVFILPSFWEGMPRSVIEAMALSKPVVVHGIGGIDEVVENGKNGYIVSIDHTSDFAEKICLLLDNGRMRREMGKAGKIKARAYDFGSIVRKTAQLYRKLSREEID